MPAPRSCQTAPLRYGDCACHPPVECATIPNVGESTDRRTGCQPVVTGWQPLPRLWSTAMSSMRRSSLVLMVVGILAGVSLMEPAVAQVRRVIRGAVMAPAVAADPNAKEGDLTDAITLPTDRDAAKLLGAAVDCIKEEDWSNACLALQKLLDSKEDSFYEERKKG